MGGVLLLFGDVILFCFSAIDAIFGVLSKNAFFVVEKCVFCL